MLKIWGRDTSSNVQKVLWTCEELSLNYERINVGGPYGGLESKEFKDLNPHSKIPVINDNGFILYESHAIIRYLAMEYGKEKLTLDISTEQGVVDQYIDWVHTELTKYMIPILIGLIRTEPKKRDMDSIIKNNTESEKQWELLDKHLEKTKWISNSNFSLADICCGVWVWRRYNLDTEKKNLNNIDRWFEDLKKRTSYKKIVMKPLS